DHHMALHSSAGGWVFAEIAFVDGVEAPEISRVIEPDAAADDVFETVAGLFEDGDDVLDGEVGLLDNAAMDDLAVLHGDLAGDIEKATGFHGTGEGQVLAPSARLFGTI